MDLSLVRRGEREQSSLAAQYALMRYPLCTHAREAGVELRGGDTHTHTDHAVLWCSGSEGHSASFVLGVNAGTARALRRERERFERVPFMLGNVVRANAAPSWGRSRLVRARTSAMRE